MSNHVEEISKFLPHREPFLFIDEIVDIELGKKIHCIKRNSFKEDYKKKIYLDGVINKHLI